MTLIIIAIILLLCEIGYFHFAERYKIVCHPTSVSSHKDVVIRGGGIIFYLGALIFFVASGFEYPWFILGLSLIAAISFLDDLSNVPIIHRATVQLISVLFLLYQVGITTTLPWWTSLIALIVCTGMINAYNFMDGINGITGAYTLSILVPLTILNSEYAFVDPSLIWITGIAVLIFSFFNFRVNARCFAGDIGSVSIAYIMLFMAIQLMLTSGNLWYLIFFAVYGVDSVLTICHRIILGDNIFERHRKHVYQIMSNELHLPHTLVATIYGTLQLAISLGALYLPIDKWLYFGVVISLLSVVYIVFINRFYRLHEVFLSTLK